MTQQIGASFFPLDTLVGICRTIMKGFKAEIKIPGLLVIDTPGHEAFVNLRRRGGSVADMAILVIDATRGFEAQTHESLEILKSRQTPFIVVANKIDLIYQWTENPDSLFLESYKKQDSAVREELDGRIYDIMGTLSQKGFRADRFDKIRDFTKTIAIVPTSAKSGEGIAELLAVLIGLTQQYLGEKLEATFGPARGTVLEVKEETGLGVTLNAIIYEGILREEDVIIVGGKEQPIVTKVRSLLMPQPLDEIRDPRKRFISVKEVHAAAGIKIAAPDLENAVAGAPIAASPSASKADELIREVSAEVEKIRIKTDKVGVILKTDTLGSLEAMTESLKEKGVPIRLADFGDVSRRDIIEAVAVKFDEPLYAAIIAFNVKILPDAEKEASEQGVRIFWSNIIYNVMEDYLKWIDAEREARARKEFDLLIKPGKIEALPGYFFRHSKPAIFGVRVQAGKITAGSDMIDEKGSPVGKIVQIQDSGQSISSATEGKEVAVSMPKVILERNVNQQDILFIDVPQEHARLLLKRYASMLTQNELEALEQTIKIKRKKDPFWAV